MGSGKMFPIPLWMIVLLFVVGASVGVGIGYFINLDQNGKASLGRLPWEDESAAKQQQVKEKVAQTNNKVAVQKKNLPPKKSDKRWLNNITKGPVKRALAKTVKVIQPDVEKILSAALKKKADSPKILAVYLQFKAMGSVATLRELRVFCDSLACADIEKKLQAKFIESRYDFPVEDGKYEMLYNFALPEKKTETK